MISRGGVIRERDRLHLHAQLAHTKETPAGSTLVAPLIEKQRGGVNFNPHAKICGTKSSPRIPTW